MEVQLICEAWMNSFLIFVSAKTNNQKQSVSNLKWQKLDKDLQLKKDLMPTNVKSMYGNFFIFTFWVMK
jgi:hypothetical protein